MKLKHRKGENPYVSAQRFLHENELDQGYLEDVARFVTKNTVPPSLEMGGGGGNPDPLTGGASYVAGSAGTMGLGA